MSYKHREPISERIMLSPKYRDHHTICGMLRQIYILAEDNEEIKLKCRIGMSMSKAMQDKLKEYKKMFEKNHQGASK